MRESSHVDASICVCLQAGAMLPFQKLLGQSFRMYVWPNPSREGKKLQPDLGKGAGSEFLRFGTPGIAGNITRHHFSAVRSFVIDKCFIAGNLANSATSDHGFDTNVIMSQSCYCTIRFDILSREILSLPRRQGSEKIF